jgi:hypothetical protein
MRRLAMTLAIVVALPAVWLLALQAADEGPTSATDPAAPAVTTSATPTTRLYVKTVPPGAQVTLDGKLLGPSDGLFMVPPGVSSVKVEFAGQEPRLQQVEIVAGRITRLEIDFAEPEAARPAAGGVPVAARDGGLAADGRLLLAAARVLRVPALTDLPALAGIPAVSEIDAALLRPLPRGLAFDDVPLREVLNRIGDVAEIAISIDEPSLTAKGLDIDAPVTIRLGGLPLGSAVSEIVRKRQLRWVGEGHRIVVTASGIDQEMVERVYRIDDLVTPNDPEGSRLLKFLSEASWPLETMPITSYRQLTFAPAVRVWTPETKIDEVVVQAPWWRQWRTGRLLALLRQLRSTPAADRLPLSADGYWSDAESAAAARAALDMPLKGDVAIDGVAIGDAIASLSQAAGVPIVFDSIALADSRLLKNRVAVRGPTKGRTLAAVLDSILDGGLCFELVRDQLTVSNRRWSSAAYYPVDDLLAAGQTFDALQSRIGSQGGPTWVIEGGVNCLAITRHTAGHRQVEKILRSLRDEERRRNANRGVDPTAVVDGLTAKEMVARCLERMDADAPVAGVFKMTEENCWPVGPDTRPDVGPVRDDPVLECRWAWDGTTTVGERLPTFSAPFGFLRTESLSLKEVAEGQWQLRTERLGTPPHPGWFYCHPEGIAWSSLVLVDPEPRFDGVPAAGSRWIRLATSGFVGEVRLWIREADVRIQGYELFLSGKLLRRLDIEHFAESDDGRAFPAKARLQTWNPNRHDEECCTRQLEAIEVEFPKGKAETARLLELVIPRGSRVDEFEHGSGRSVATKFIREPTSASEVMARSQLRGATAERPPAPTGGATPHEAVASLRVLQPDKDDYEVYRKTQAQLSKSPFVFQKALREPGIAELPTLAAEKDPVGWLSKHVQASAPSDSEIIQVRLRGENADDVTRILEAITTVYLKEVVQKERRERIERRRALEKTHQKAVEELRLARETLAHSTDDSDRERLRGDVTKLEQATKRMKAELDHAAESISSIPDRIELIEAARSSDTAQ